MTFTSRTDQQVYHLGSGKAASGRLQLTFLKRVAYLSLSKMPNRCRFIVQILLLRTGESLAVGVCTSFFGATTGGMLPLAQSPGRAGVKLNTVVLIRVALSGIWAGKSSRIEQQASIFRSLEIRLSVL